MPTREKKVLLVYFVNGIMKTILNEGSVLVVSDGFSCGGKKRERSKDKDGNDLRMHLTRQKRRRRERKKLNA